MPEVYISVGSNIEPEANIRAALSLLTSAFGELEVSTIYESEAVGFTGPNFYNLVVKFHSDLSLSEIKTKLHNIESIRGRNHGGKEFADRTLDLDIILYGDFIEHSSSWDIPRRDILSYAFVLCPLAEISGDTKHPELQESYAALWEKFSDRQPLWPVELIDVPAYGRASQN